MNLQEIIVIIIFIVAVLYAARMIYAGLKPKSGCGQGCKCSIDFSDSKLNRNP